MNEEDNTAEIIDLTMPRTTTAPTANIIKPTKSVNVADLTLDLTKLEGTGGQTAPLGIPVGRPGEFQYFRTHPKPEFRPTMFCISYVPPGQKSGELNIIAPSMRHLFVGTTSAGAYQLYTVMDRIGNMLIVPVKLPGADGRTNDWNRTRQLCLEKAVDGWLRMYSNQATARYEYQTSPTKIPDPIWPDLSPGEVWQIAFGDLDRIIDREDHAIVKKMRGLL